MKRRLLIMFLLGWPATVRGTGTTWYIPFCANNGHPFQPQQSQPDGRLATFRRANKCDRQY